MQIVVMGAGIAGVLAAYFLGREGHAVTVIDRQAAAAMECSYANGGQLSYSHAEPWANPYVFPKLFKWALKDDAPLVMRLRADADMMRWGLRFLWNCQPGHARRHAEVMLRIGLFSRTVLHEIIEETGIAFHHHRGGILHVFSEASEFEHARKQAAFQESLGCKEEVLSWEECQEKEPSLANSQKRIYGGIYSPIDESGDIHRFTQALAAYCETHFNAVFRYQTTIERIEADGEEITAVITDQGSVRGDAYVMALGAYAPIHLRPIGVHVPIYPMKGYSITFPANQHMPTVSVTDDALKIVYSRLGDVVRCAGTAEFAGYNHDVRAVRIEPIKRGIRTLFPQADLSQATEWACLRPSTPDGPPILGATRYRNLYLNTGHGTLGWTQGPGTAKLLAEVIHQQTPSISLDGLTLARYR